MEYLMTYGWAVLVIVIVIAVLFSFTSLFKIGDNCLFSQKSFSCSDPTPQVLTDGSLIFSIKNLGQKEILVANAACASEDYAGEFAAQFTERGIAPGASYTFTKDTGVKCRRSGGALVSPREGDEFRGKLLIKYKYSDEPPGYEERQASATLVSTVVAGTSASGNQGDALNPNTANPGNGGTENLCGNGVIEPGEDCETNLDCPAGVCSACSCGNPQ